MFIPDPLLALIVSHLTDGQPVRRVLAGTRGVRGSLTRVVDMVAYQVAREKEDRFSKYVALAVVPSEASGWRETVYDRVMNRLDDAWKRPEGVLLPMRGIPEKNYIFYDYDRGGVGVCVMYRNEPVWHTAIIWDEPRGASWHVCWLEDEIVKLQS